jgi:hypothetical protein
MSTELMKLSIDCELSKFPSHQPNSTPAPRPRPRPHPQSAYILAGTSLPFTTVMLVYVHTAGGTSAVPNIDPMARAALEILETNY